MGCAQGTNFREIKACCQQKQSSNKEDDYHVSDGENATWQGGPADNIPGDPEPEKDKSKSAITRSIHEV